MIIERLVPSLVFHHQPKQTTSLDCIYQGSELRRRCTRILPPLEGGVEVLHLGDLRRRNHLDDNPCDMATGLHGEVCLQVVEEHSAHWPC